MVFKHLEISKSGWYSVGGSGRMGAVVGSGRGRGRGDIMGLFFVIPTMTSSLPKKEYPSTTKIILKVEISLCVFLQKKQTFEDKW